MIALDTNILVYAASSRDTSGRHEKALNLLQQLGASGAIVPLPVLGELLNVRRKKQFSPLTVLTHEIEIWTSAFDMVTPEYEDYLKAAEISDAFNLQYFDALILTVAARAGARMLLSEDMQDGLEVESLQVVNPFAADNETLLAEYFASAL